MIKQDDHAFSKASSSKPTETGLWLMRCMENDYQWESIIITNSEHGLMAHCPDLGPTLLEHYHYALSDIEWRRPMMKEATYF